MRPHIDPPQKDGIWRLKNVWTEAYSTQIVWFFLSLNELFLIVSALWCHENTERSYCYPAPLAKTFKEESEAMFSFMQWTLDKERLLYVELTWTRLRVMETRPTVKKPYLHVHEFITLIKKLTPIRFRNGVRSTGRINITPLIQTMIFRCPLWREAMALQVNTSFQYVYVFTCSRKSHFLSTPLS